MTSNTLGEDLSQALQQGLRFQDYYKQAELLLEVTALIHSQALETHARRQGIYPRTKV
jgi:hypothetical protein